MTALTDYLAEIKARADAATGGPWHEEAGNVCGADARLVATGSRIYPVAVDDANFIAAARTDVPKLVAALEAVLRLIETEPWDPEEQDAVSAIRNAITSALGVTR
jgi:hypothetical protein